MLGSGPRAPIWLMARGALPSSPDGPLAPGTEAREHAVWAVVNAVEARVAADLGFAQGAADAADLLTEAVKAAALTAREAAAGVKQAEADADSFDESAAAASASGAKAAAAAATGPSMASLRVARAHRRVRVAARIQSSLEAVAESAAAVASGATRLGAVFDPAAKGLLSAAAEAMEMAEAERGGQ